MILAAALAFVVEPTPQPVVVNVKPASGNNWLLMIGTVAAALIVGGLAFWNAHVDREKRSKEAKKERDRSDAQNAADRAHQAEQSAADRAHTLELARRENQRTAYLESLMWCGRMCDVAVTALTMKEPLATAPNDGAAQSRRTALEALWTTPQFQTQSSEFRRLFITFAAAWGVQTKQWGPDGEREFSPEMTTKLAALLEANLRLREQARIDVGADAESEP